VAKEESPAFQYYPRDYLSDAKVRAMSYKERGMYWELVSLLWGEHVLPANIDQLAKILAVPIREFRRHWPAISPCFRVVGDDIEHGRLEEERRNQQRFRDGQSTSGKAGAEKRWGKGRHSEPIATPSSENSKPTVSPMAKNGSSSSSSSSKEERAHTTRVLYQSSRPNRMNPGGVVPLIDTQFGEFVSRVSPEYPDRSAAYAAVLAWVGREDDAAVSAGRRINTDPFKWWRERFDTWTRDDRPPVPTVCRRRHSPACLNDADCTRRYLDEQQGAPAVVA
jgi:uncharacterized protein YdaU (DUF1376 family)